MVVSLTSRALQVPSTLPQPWRLSPRSAALSLPQLLSPPLVPSPTHQPLHLRTRPKGLPTSRQAPRLCHPPHHLRASRTLLHHHSPISRLLLVTLGLLWFRCCSVSYDMLAFWYMDTDLDIGYKRDFYARTLLFAYSVGLLKLNRGAPVCRGVLTFHRAWTLCLGQ